MVAKAWHADPVQGSRTKYLKAVVHFSYLHSHGTQIVRDCGDTIAFLHAQFFCVANNRFALCKGASDCKDRQFINKLRYFLTLNDSALERETGDFNNSARFDLIDVLNGLAHLRTHAKQNTE